MKDICVGVLAMTMTLFNHGARNNSGSRNSEILIEDDGSDSTKAFERA